MGKIADALDKAGYVDELIPDSEQETLEFERATLEPEQEILKPEREILEPEREMLEPEREILEPERETLKPEQVSTELQNQQSSPSHKKEKNLKSPLNVSGKWDKRLFKSVNNDSVIPEVFKTLRSKILHPLDDRSVPKTIMVASSLAQEGKSFVAANLGVSFANGMDQHCLLVDCDLRHPNLSQMFGIKTKYGLADYLRDQVDLAGLIAKTSVQKLSILPSGQVPQNPAELLSSSRMQNLMQEVSRRYDDRIVIFDSPPMLMAAEASVLSGYVDAVILVIRQGKAKKDEVQKFIDSVGEDKILGIVFNDHTTNYTDRGIVSGYGY